AISSAPTTRPPSTSRSTTAVCSRTMLRGRPQGPLDRPPGRIAAGMQDPRPAVSTLEAQRVGAARPLGPIEADAAVDQLGDRLRPLTAQHPHRLVLAQSHAGRPGVAGVLVGAVRGA